MAEPDIDALIEEGLTRYGRGDLDGALLVWEEALGIDPDNEQANSYVDYVRQNYDLLTGSELISDEAAAPFGIEDDEYSVEIIEGAVLAPAAASVPDAVDDGWFIDSGGTSAAPVAGPDDDMPGAARADAEATAPAAVVEIEADEPPRYDGVPAPAPVAASRRPSAARIDDDDDEPEIEVTRPTLAIEPDAERDDEPEISVTAAEPEPEPAPEPEPEPEPPPDEPVVAASEAESDAIPEEPVTPVEPSYNHDFPSGGHTPGFEDGLAADSTPVGFAAQVTDVRVRDLGFVMAKPPDPPPPPPAPPSPEPPPADHPLPEPAPPSESPEKPEMNPDLPSTPPPPLRTPTLDKIETAIAAADAVPPLAARAPTPPRHAFGPEATATEQSAGTPAADTPPPMAAETASDIPDETHAEVLAAPRNPHAPDTDDVIMPPSPSARTRELPLSMQMPTFADDRNKTRDLSWEVGQEARKLTQRLPLGQQIDISAPTRELGMRPTRTDIMTARLDARSSRAAVPTTPPLSTGDLARVDIQSPFDPIDARGAAILDDIDVNAPPSEAKEDRTRRRITALIEKSAEWQRGLDMEKAVTAIDLALAEDPNSALAQKLIHRNRETIMSVFQSYIGDLARAPLLARPLHELASAPISPRAAFLLSRVDGTMSIDEILDVSGMPRLEAFRYLCQLLLRGILK